MLIEFSVENFLSIRDKATLSLVKGTGTELFETNTFECSAPSTPSLLASAAIYGPNGAGKTTIIKAIQVMRSIVCGTASKNKPGETIPVVPFRLDEICVKLPTEFDIVFAVDGVRYQYGFSATTERVYDEWLFAYPKGRPRRLIERSYSEETGSYVWGSMDKLAGQKQVWQESTRANNLFLTTAVQLNSAELHPIYEWFQKRLHIVGLQGWTGMFSVGACEDESSRKGIEKILRLADTGIEGIEVDAGHAYGWDEVIYNPEEFPSRKSLKTVHRTSSGQAVKFDFDDESDGTRKLFDMAGPWLKVLREGHVLVVDELNDNLHSHMVGFLVQLFHDKRVNRKGAQLIFTTHDTSLLNQHIFRRDQIWLCEKDDTKASVFYSLTEFSPRKGVENIERGYLVGRYGALPHLQDLADGLVD